MDIGARTSRPHGASNADKMSALRESYLNMYSLRGIDYHATTFLPIIMDTYDNNLTTWDIIYSFG